MKRKEPPTKTFKGNPKRIKASPNVLVQKKVGTGPEKKNVDVGATLALPATAVTWVLSGLLTPLAQGDIASGRQGRKVRYLSFSLRWSAFAVATSLNGCNVRCKVVYDKQANGAAPTVAAIMADDSFYSHNDLDNAERFITICDFITDPITLPTGAAFSQSGSVNRKIDLDQLWFGANAGGAITDLTTGSFYLLASQSGTMTTAGPSFNFNSRFRYTDN